MLFRELRDTALVKRHKVPSTTCFGALRDVIEVVHRQGYFVIVTGQDDEVKWYVKVDERFKEPLAKHMGSFNVHIGV